MESIKLCPLFLSAPLGPLDQLCIDVLAINTLTVLVKGKRQKVSAQDKGKTEENIDPLSTE